MPCGRPLAVLFLVMAGWLGLSEPAAAGDRVVAPEEISGVTKVDAEGLLDLINKTPSLVIIDARMRQDRLQGDIEGSISLPDVDTTCAALAKFVSHKSSPVLFYCNGPKCARSAHSCRKALACGYTDIYWFRGGFEEWKQKDYPFVRE